jgi:enamine deaminase RidA (YjgF/YER057c/UK114 family)
MRDWLGGNSALEGKSAVSTAGGPATISGRHRTRKRRNAMTERPDAADPATGSVRYVDPEGLHKNPAFTNVVVVEGPVRTVHVGGQNAVDASGNIVGKGDIAAQTEQVLANVRAALAAGGAEPEHVIKWNLLLVEGVSLQEGFSAKARWSSSRGVHDAPLHRSRGGRGSEGRSPRLEASSMSKASKRSA